MIIIMYGQDSYSLHRELLDIKKKLDSSEMLDINTSLLDGEQLTFSELQNMCNTVPFLCPVRLIIIEGLLQRFEPKSGYGRTVKRAQLKSSSGMKEWQSLGDFIKSMPSTTVLILLDSKISGKNSLLQSIAPLAQVKTFPSMSKPNLAQWIQKEITKQNSSISSGAINMLIEFVGTDLWAMNNEINKLLSFTSGHPISEDDIMHLTSYAQEANIFTMVDAIIEGKMKIAQQLLHRLWQDGESPSYILIMITRQLRLIIRAKELSPSKSRSQALNELGLTSDYAFDKTIKQSRICTMQKLKRAYHKVLDTDMVIKTGRYSSNLAVDLLVIELCIG